jgi:hypothetical protein
MKDKRKIVLGIKDVVPQENNDVFLNVELSRTSDELVNEIIDNNFNLFDQFITEREQSLKFCVYGTLNSIISDTDDVVINIRTNHNDIMHVPRIQPNAKSSTSHTIKTLPLSKYNNLSKNIFKKNKSSFYYIFELGAFYNNVGETKSLILRIDNRTQKLFAEVEIPFLYFDADGNKVPYGTETVDIDIDGNEQDISNDYPFLYDTHWVKSELNLPRPLRLSFRRSLFEAENNATADESDGEVNFLIGLDAPSIYGIEEAEVYIKEDNTIRNPNEDFVFTPQKLSWNIGEQFKEVKINLLDDLFVESAETVVFAIRNEEYSEQDVNNEFTLNINDKDKPTPIGFQVATKTIQENDEVLTIKLILESPMNVPNQSIDVYIDDATSTAIIGEDVENTGTQEAAEFRKTINIPEGEIQVSFDIEIFNDFKYEFEKTAIFKLDNPTQNVKIDETRNEYVLNIQDSMITRYTRYTIPGDSSKGYGLFRMNNNLITTNSEVLRLKNSNTSTENDGIGEFTTDFSYTVEIINKGEDIIFGDKLVGFNQVVKYFELTNGFEGLSIELPSNDDLDQQNRQFRKSKYQFSITEIQPIVIQNQPLSSNLNTLEQKARRFDNIIIVENSLNASLPASTGVTEYFMVSDVSNIKTKLDYNALTNVYNCTEDIVNKSISVRMNGSVILNEIFTEQTSSGGFLGIFGGSNQTGTILTNVTFEPQLVEYTYCTGDTVQISGSTAEVATGTTLNSVLIPVEPA